MKIAIVGTGYVGLVTGISLAKLGHQVICIETDKNKISAIKKGKSPFHEPDIDKFLNEVIKKKLLDVTDNLEEGVVNSDITIIAVGTPTINNKIDLTAIKKATEQIGKALGNMKKYHVVAVKSTVLPGVTGEIVQPILEENSGKKIGEFGLVMNPEFLREGNALDDALHPDRIVIGAYDEKSGKTFAKIYKNVSTPKVFTNLWTAELTKYASNSLFATLISFANEIARISETIGKVDTLEVWKGVHLDKRLSPYNGDKRIKPGVLSYILSGCGFGGSCFPKDVQALASFASELGTEPQLLKSVININKTQPHRTIVLLKNALGENLKNKKIAILGLTFKSNTDDMRESPALTIIEKLLDEGAKITGHDPMAYKKAIPKELGNLSIKLTKTVKEAIHNADATIIVTAWNDYVKLTPKFFKQNMKRPIVIDARRIYDKHLFLNAGIIYKGIGL